MKRTQCALVCMVLAFCLCSTASSAGFTKAGKSIMQFLKIGIGARQVGMGEAAIASVEDVNAVFWNPAGLRGVESAEASFGYTKWFADLNYLAGAAAIRWPGVGVFAVEYTSLDYGQMDEAVVSLAGRGNDTRTGNTFGGGDLMVGISYSREFTDRLSIGGTVKYLQEKLYTYKGTAVAYDVGTNYDFRYNGLHVAMSAQNFGPTVSWLEHGSQVEGYDLPLTFRIGASINIFDRSAGFFKLGENHRFVFSAEAIHSNDTGDRVHICGEYTFNELLAFRAGYRLNYDEGNLALGVGLKHSFSGVTVRFDYAFVSYTYLESPHRFSLSMEF